MAVDRLIELHDVNKYYGEGSGALAVDPEAPLSGGPASACDPEMTDTFSEVVRQLARDDLLFGILKH